MLRRLLLTTNLLFLAQFTHYGYSAQEAKDENPFFIVDWSQGLNTRDPAHKMNGNPSMSNVRIDEAIGKVVTRKGFSSVGATTTLSKVNFLGEFITNAGEREMIISDSSRVFTTRDFNIYTVLKNTQNPNALHSMAQGRGRALICNGTDPCFTYDGSIVTLLDGQGNRPNVPRGKYVSFYLDRFWVFNTTANNSALHWSALSSTDGIALSPFDTLAWPAVNQLNIGLGDGVAGSGLDVFSGQLQCHKYNKGIHTIFGTDDTDFFARETNSEVGTVSQDSIVQLDNLEYFLAKDGWYAFDSKDAVRISDQISPDIESIVTNLSNIVADTWDTQADFIDERQSISGTTVNASGYVTTFTSQTVNTFVTGQTVQLTALASTTFLVAVDTTEIDAGNIYTGFLARINYSVSGDPAGWTQTINFTFRNDASSVEYVASENVLLSQTSDLRNFVVNSTFPISTQDILDGKLKLQVSVGTTTLDPPSRLVGISTISRIGLTLGNTTGSYISAITTITAANITNWDTFLANTETNGGNVRYYVRASSSATHIATETWTQIQPGNAIDFIPAKNFIQWASTINTLNYEPDLNVDAKVHSVTINHNESGSADSRPIALTFKNRIHMFVTTQTAGTVSIGYVKSKNTNTNPNAIMRDDGINVKALSKFGDSFYAGSSTAGVILRLENGTNDMGAATAAHIETPDLFFGDLFKKKILNTYYIDLDRKVDANFTIGTSIEGGAYSNITKSISGSGRYLFPVRNVLNKGKFFRFRFSNNEIDKGLSLSSFGVSFQPTEIDE